jgi:hypothetical protein
MGDLFSAGLASGSISPTYEEKAEALFQALTDGR